MQLSGKVIKVYDPQSGTSDRGAWVRQNFVIETQESYPKRVCFEVSNTNLINLVSVDDLVVVTFIVMSREYQERWYTTVKAVGIGKMAEQQSANPIDNI